MQGTMTREQTSQQFLWEATAREIMQALGIKLAPEWEKPFFGGARIILAMGGEGSVKNLLCWLGLHDTVISNEEDNGSYDVACWRCKKWLWHWKGKKEVPA